MNRPGDEELERVVKGERSLIFDSRRSSGGGLGSLTFLRDEVGVGQRMRRCSVLPQIFHEQQSSDILRVDLDSSVSGRIDCTAHGLTFSKTRRAAPSSTSVDRNSLMAAASFRSSLISPAEPYISSMRWKRATKDSPFSPFFSASSRSCPSASSSAPKSWLRQDCQFRSPLVDEKRTGRDSSWPRQCSDARSKGYFESCRRRTSWEQDEL